MTHIFMYGTVRACRPAHACGIQSGGLYFPALFPLAPHVLASFPVYAPVTSDNPFFFNPYTEELCLNLDWKTIFQ